jgi:hypothetical protein
MDLTQLLSPDLLDYLPYLLGIQIGPRIRVGGSIGKAAQSAKIGLGKVAKAAAPIAGFINPALGGVLGGLGTIADTSKGKVGLGQIASAGGAALLPGVAKVAGKIPGVSGMGGMLGKIPGVSKVGGLAKRVAGSQFGKDMGTALKNTAETILDPVAQAGGAMGDALTGGGGGPSMDTMLGLAGTADAAIQRQKATDLENQGLNRIRGAYDAKAGLREQGIQGMMRPEGDPNAALANTYRRDTGNPYDLPPVAPAAPAGPGGPSGGVPPVRPVPRPRRPL